jgi:Na+:H+ antiporter, NhaA family
MPQSTGAIPAATDIAFALGVLALLGSRAPVSLKIFLTAVAIIDDLGAILVIAIFYTEQIAFPMLAAAAAAFVVLIAANRLGVRNLGVYALLGSLLWYFALKSGIHATIAGVLTALCVPISRDHSRSPLHIAEHALHPWIAFAVLPIFAFANAGVSLADVGLSAVTESVTMGIVFGLVIGKAIGVFGGAWIMIRLFGSPLPPKASWTHLIGVCLLCGIGFTMSLFIGGLAFLGQGAGYEVQVKVGVLLGSAIAGALGALLVSFARRS